MISKYIEIANTYIFYYINKLNNAYYTVRMIDHAACINFLLDTRTFAINILSFLDTFSDSDSDNVNHDLPASRY